MKKLLLFILFILCLCACEDKYKDEPFYRIEFTCNGARYQYEDMGERFASIFGPHYEKHASGAQFHYESIDEIVRRACYSINVMPGHGFGEFKFSLLSDDAFFYVGQDYSMEEDIDERNHENDFENICRRLSGTCSFHYPSDMAIDRYVMKFKMECERPKTQYQLVKDTIQITDGYLTICRRMTDGSRIRDLILYEK